MGSTSDIRAGKAYVELTAKDSMKEGLQSATKSLLKFMASVDFVKTLTPAGKGIGKAFSTAFGGITKSAKTLYNNIDSTVGNSFRIIRGSAKALQNSLDNFFANSRFGDGLRAIELKMRNFSVSVRNLGLDLIKFGVLAGTPVVFSVKSYADFEEALARISTFLPPLSDKMGKFKKDILELSDKTGFSAKELANAVAEGLSANIDPSKVMDVVAQSAKGAIGNMIDLGQQMHATIVLMSAYKDAGLSAAKATDIFRVIVEQGIIPADQFAETVGAVAGQAALAGVSLEELAASYTAVSQSGLTVSEQTTRIRGFLETITNGSPDAKAAFMEITKSITGTAMSLSDETLNTMGLEKFLNLIKDLSITDLGRIFTNSKAAAGAALLTANLENFKKALIASRGSAGLADLAFAKMMETLTRLGKQLLESGRNLAIQFGEVLLPTLRSIASILIDVTKVIGAFIKQNPELALTLTKIAATAIAVGAALLAVGLAASIVSTVLSGIVAVGSFVFGAIGSILSAATGLVAFLFSGTGVIVAFGIALAGVFVDFGAIFDDVVGSVKSSFNGLKGIFINFKDDILKTFDLVKRAVAAKDYDLAVRIIANKIKMIWFEMVSSVTKKYEDIKTKLQSILQENIYFVKTFINGMLREFSRVTTLNVFSGIGELFDSTFIHMDGTLSGFVKTWISLWSTLKEVALVTLKTLQDIWGNFQKNVIKTMAHIADADPNDERGTARTEAFSEALDKVDELTKKEKALRDNMVETPDTLGGMSPVVMEWETVKNDLEKAEKFKAALTELLDLRDNLTSSTFGKDENDPETLKKFQEKAKIVRDLYNSVLGKKESFTKLIAIFEPDSNIKKTLDAMLNNNYQERNLRDTGFKTSIANIEKLSNASIAAIEKEAALKKKLEDELAEKKKREDFYYLQRLADAEERQKEEVENREKFKKLYESIESVLSQAFDFWSKLFSSDTRLNPKKSQGQGEEEIQKIRDGIDAAFNTNALGDYSKGDVQKSQLEILKDIAKKAEEQRKRDEEANKVSVNILKVTEEGTVWG